SRTKYNITVKIRGSQPRDFPCLSVRGVVDYSTVYAFCRIYSLFVISLQPRSLLRGGREAVSSCLRKNSPPPLVVVVTGFPDGQNSTGCPRLGTSTPRPLGSPASAAYTFCLSSEHPGGFRWIIRQALPPQGDRLKSWQRAVGSVRSLQFEAE